MITAVVERAKRQSIPPTKPQFHIDWSVVDTMLAQGCVGTEIAATLGIAGDTLYYRCQTDHGIIWTEYSQVKRAKGDAMIKVKQFNLAMKEHPGMLIWLGKNRLKQTDRPTIDNIDPAILAITQRYLDEIQKYQEQAMSMENGGTIEMKTTDSNNDSELPVNP